MYVADVIFSLILVPDPPQVDGNSEAFASLLYVRIT